MTTAHALAVPNLEPAEYSLAASCDPIVSAENSITRHLSTRRCHSVVATPPSRMAADLDEHV